jgi:hypothetical protein
MNVMLAQESEHIDQTMSAVYHYATVWQDSVAVGREGVEARPISDPGILSTRNTERDLFRYLAFNFFLIAELGRLGAPRRQQARRQCISSRQPAPRPALGEHQAQWLDQPRRLVFGRQPALRRKFVHRCG